MEHLTAISNWGQDKEVAKFFSEFDTNVEKNPPQKCYLAFLDILGFKKFIDQNTNYSELHKIKINFLKKIAHGFFQRVTHSNLLQRQEVRTNEESINTIIVSDSIIFWTNNCSKESLKKIIDYTIDILWASFLEGLPLRGSISKGNLISTKWTNQWDSSCNAIWGDSLIKAYEKEGHLHLAGCILDIENNPINEVTNDSEYKDKIVQYDIPIKNKTNENSSFGKEGGKLLNWTQSPLNLTSTVIGQGETVPEQFDQTETIVNESFEKHNKTMNKDSNEKRENTINFYKFLKSKGINTNKKQK